MGNITKVILISQPVLNFNMCLYVAISSTWNMLAFYVEMSIEVCTGWNSRGTLQWKSQWPMMIELLLNFSKTLLYLMNLIESSQYIEQDTVGGHHKTAAVPWRDWLSEPGWPKAPAHGHHRPNWTPCMLAGTQNCHRTYTPAPKMVVPSQIWSG